MAGMPAFFMVLIEDLFKRGKIVERHGATFASALLACCPMFTSIQSVGVIGFNSLLPVWVLSTAFRPLTIDGIPNSVNIIDGFNGVASGTAAIELLVVGVISLKVRDTPLAAVCLVLRAAPMGPLLTLPFGKSFLGDRSAHLLGFALGWIAVLVPSRNKRYHPGPLA
jgi:UDP-N-acetylmuramyl pentapeptide phosphotransferase/UDP-N-acetylglucosamine-1-phosphate transferase